MLLKYGLLILAYILGSIPFSIILGKIIKNIDIRHHGSGNPGGTNAMRFLGSTTGLLVMFLDGFKAGIIVLLIHLEVINPELVFNPLLYGVVAAFGHVFSIFLKFKGGKAVAATIGIMIGYNLIYAAIMFVVFMIVLKLWKYVSLASTISVFSLVLISIYEGFITENWSMLIYMSILTVLVTVRHKSNFDRIKNDTESKVKWI
jgi:glycerol-3-phosphate acyltransferase PlsY